VASGQTGETAAIVAHDNGHDDTFRLLASSASFGELFFNVVCPYLNFKTRYVLLFRREQVTGEAWYKSHCSVG
jgi:hypothetical protein